MLCIVVWLQRIDVWDKEGSGKTSNKRLNGLSFVFLEQQADIDTYSINTSNTFFVMAETPEMSWQIVGTENTEYRR